MSYKTLVALLESEETAPRIANAVIDMANLHNAHIIGMHGETIDPLPMYSPFDVPDTALMTSLYQAAADRRASLEAIFAKTIGQSGIPHEWRVYRGTPGGISTGMVQTTRCADLIVTGQPRPGFPAESHDLLFESGRPVLFIPWVTQMVKPFGRILVAWDGSREAAHATFDALPFLKRANEVEIYSVDPEDSRTQSGSVAGADLAATLDRHGIRVTLSTARTTELPVSALIENRVADMLIDLLVMGAYSHSRLRETIFGGVTRTLLESMTTPTLMSR